MQNTYLHYPHVKSCSYFHSKGRIPSFFGRIIFAHKLRKFQFQKHSASNLAFAGSVPLHFPASTSDNYVNACSKDTIESTNRFWQLPIFNAVIFFCLSMFRIFSLIFFVLLRVIMPLHPITICACLIQVGKGRKKVLALIRYWNVLFGQKRFIYNYNLRLEPRFQDTLKKASPLKSDFGMRMLKKMGWSPGEGLGKDKSGPLEPMLFDIKMDKKGGYFLFTFIF